MKSFLASTRTDSQVKHNWELWRSSVGWDTPLSMCSPLPDSGLKDVHLPASMKTSLTAAGGGGLHPPSFWSSPFSVACNPFTCSTWSGKSMFTILFMIFFFSLMVTAIFNSKWQVITVKKKKKRDNAEKEVKKKKTLPNLTTGENEPPLTRSYFIHYFFIALPTFQLMLPAHVCPEWQETLRKETLSLCPSAQGKGAIRQPPDRSTDEQKRSVLARGGGVAGRSEMTFDILNSGLLSCFLIL